MSDTILAGSWVRITNVNGMTTGNRWIGREGVAYQTHRYPGVDDYSVSVFIDGTHLVFRLSELKSIGPTKCQKCGELGRIYPVEAEDFINGGAPIERYLCSDCVRGSKDW